MLHRMLVAALCVTVLSCGSRTVGSKGSKGGEGGEGGGGEEIIIKKAALGWGIKPAGSGADVFLAITDETGRATSHPLGRYDGECSVLAGGRPATGAVTAVLCKRGDIGFELDAVPRPGVIIVLKMPYAEGADPDPLSGEEVAHIAVPVGAKIETAN
jgi:hypothetical protein